ncbi:MAG: hypothetical protein K2X81_27060 [Candidatus Obscuribacterales bacterium]|nr:hypothetical protein [Candidatus Obscuribacterales bacterium]
MSDNKVNLDLPEEFLELCKRDKVAPARVLCGFIADLCDINIGWYRSHGADEGKLARQYYERVGYSNLAGGSKDVKKG